MTLRTALRLLLLTALGLPLLQAVLMWVAGLLRAMGDEAAAAVIGHVSTAAGIMWVAALVGLIVALAFESLQRKPLE